MFALTTRQRDILKVLLEASTPIGTAELARQQALAALVWGETPFGDSLTGMTHHGGLTFSLEIEAGLLPIVQRTIEILNHWHTQRVTGLVAYAEEQLGGRFTDDAVLYLSLALAILTERVQSGHHLDLAGADLEWLQSLPVWLVARNISRRIGWHPSGQWLEADIAGIAMQFLAAPRSEVWPGDTECRRLKYFWTAALSWQGLSRPLGQPGPFYCWVKTSRLF